MTEDRKIEEYQDKLYIKEYTDKKSILFFICQIFILTHFNIQSNKNKLENKNKKSNPSLT